MQWTAESFAHVRSIVEANERIADLARTARRLGKQNAALRERVAHLRAQQAAPVGVRSSPRRVVAACAVTDRARGHSLTEEIFSISAVVEMAGVRGR